MGKKLKLIIFISSIFFILIKCASSYKYNYYNYNKDHLLEGPIRLDLPSLDFKNFDLKKYSSENHLNLKNYSAFYAYTTKPQKLIDNSCVKVYSEPNVYIFRRANQLFIYMSLSRATKYNNFFATEQKEQDRYYTFREMANKGVVGVLFIFW